MDVIAGLGHLLNFFAPAVGVGLIASLLAKLTLRRALRTKSWLSLAVLTSGAGAVVLLGGLLVFGRDGKMATYAALVAVVALVLWWKGLGQT